MHFATELSNLVNAQGVGKTFQTDRPHTSVSWTISTMFVRVSPDNGKPLNFEIDVKFPFASPEVQHSVQEIIFKETG